MIDLATNIGLISKSGAWYAYEGDKIGQGRENAKTYLRENPEFCDMIDARVREYYFSNDGDSENEEELPADDAKDETAE